MPRRITEGGASRPVTNSLSAAGKPLNVMKRENMFAETIIRIIMAVFLAVSLSEKTKLPHLSRLCTSPITMAPKAPMAPASVGVKMPPYIPPITTRNKITTGKTPGRDTTFSLKVVLGPGGP